MGSAKAQFESSIEIATIGSGPATNTNQRVLLTIHSPGLRLALEIQRNLEAAVSISIRRPSSQNRLYFKMAILPDEAAIRDGIKRVRLLR